MALLASSRNPCLVCGGSTHARFALCFCCDTTVHQLQMPLAPVVAMVEYRTGDRLHRRLRGYKDAPVAEARHACAAELARLVRSWLAADPARLAHRFGSDWDVVTTVPSTTRPRAAPAEALVDQVPDLARGYRRLLERGPEPTDHLVAARRGFEVPAEVGRSWLGTRRVLVFDDSITTGSRAQSAVAALRMAGAQVVGILAVARAVGGAPVDRRPSVAARSRLG
jgi:adenine/guanine phosphoribosyltransferase-like PRPP-binding protein